jgi:hypothetical protein
MKIKAPKVEFFNEIRPDGKITGRRYQITTTSEGKMFVKWLN